MFSTFRNKFGAPGLIAVAALVFAMLGGAYAASGPDGGKATASAKGKKGKKGPRGPRGFKGATGAAGAVGPAGADGPAGPAGPAGPQGPAGPKGTTGADGADGESVTVTEVPVGEFECGERGGAIVEEQDGDPSVEVCNGEPGEQGKDGDPWAPESTLPEDATLTGSWSLHVGPGSEIALIGGRVATDISFAIKLAAAPTRHYSTEANFADFDEAGPETVGCTGTIEAPTAPSGHLCVYQGFINNMAFGSTSNLKLNAAGTTSGVMVTLTVTNDANPALVTGSYAVTG